MLAKLDQFIFTEDVQLGDVTETFAGDGDRRAWRRAGVARALIGIVRASCWPRCPSTATCASTSRASRRSSLRIDRYSANRASTCWSSATSCGALRERAARRRAPSTLDAAAAEALRVEAGVPKFHRDMDEDTIPLEAGIESRAISLTKGCYVGQEVIIRVLHRGHGRVARRLVGLTLDGDGAAAPGRRCKVDGREIGR